jgi:hypothetical protein
VKKFMPRRIYVKGKKTHAKGQNFKQDNVGAEKERFFITIELVSLKRKLVKENGI